MNKTYQGSERFVASFLVLPSAWSYNSGHTATLRLALRMSAAVMRNYYYKKEETTCIKISGKKSTSRSAL